ncbi:hypothetical protein EVAR_102154_1 [Eumeta japonica]|uniref:Uncharacterized protein n=1 Tax=Eumeta variegata TaxID=151549 RepID=A0A4C1TZV9_EUMVA|nr:hypothetical protein EVAR_102154_1 [Eumeta japonica]
MGFYALLRFIASSARITNAARYRSDVDKSMPVSIIFRVTALNLSAGLTNRFGTPRDATLGSRTRVMPASGGRGTAGRRLDVAWETIQIDSWGLKTSRSKSNCFYFVHEQFTNSISLSGNRYRPADDCPPPPSPRRLRGRSFFCLSRRAGNTKKDSIVRSIQRNHAG